MGSAESTLRFAAWDFQGKFLRRLSSCTAICGSFKRQASEFWRSWLYSASSISRQTQCAISVLCIQMNLVLLRSILISQCNILVPHQATKSTVSSPGFAGDTDDLELTAASFQKSQLGCISQHFAFIFLAAGRRGEGCECIFTMTAAASTTSLIPNKLKQFEKGKSPAVVLGTSAASSNSSQVEPATESTVTPSLNMSILSSSSDEFLPELLSNSRWLAFW